MDTLLIKFGGRDIFFECTAMNGQDGVINIACDLDGEHFATLPYSINKKFIGITRQEQVNNDLFMLLLTAIEQFVEDKCCLPGTERSKKH